MTILHRGGGHKRRYRIVDFRREKENVEAKVVSIEYDPNRSSRIALIKYPDGDWRYILAPNGTVVGDRIMAGEGAEIRRGNALPLASIPPGTMVHNIELRPGKGGQIVRSAGGAAQAIGVEVALAGALNITVVNRSAQRGDDMLLAQLLAAQWIDSERSRRWTKALVDFARQTEGNSALLASSNRIERVRSRPSTSS